MTRSTPARRPDTEDGMRSHATTGTGKTARHIALLRGINVGGRNSLPMARLVSIFETIGCQGVRTYIQSGNVVSAP